MALDTFTPPVAPSPGTTRKPMVKVLEADFGDGYSQPTPDGINHIRKVVTLTWDALTVDQMNEIEAFFEAHLGTTAFWFQPYGFADPILWTCSDWSSTTPAGYATFAATLKQSFSTAA